MSNFPRAERDLLGGRRVCRSAVHRRSELAAADAAAVGVGGITLGGGVGFLVRKLGLTIDSLLAAEVVTADSRHLRVDTEHHADLFWAVRGGGGNFGVVTRLHFRLHELTEFAGDRESADRAIAPFRSLATPHADMVKPGPYVAMYQPEDPNFHPAAAGRTMFVDSIDSARAEAVVEYLSKSDAAMRVAQIRVLGGAAARIPSDATAYAHRSKPILVNVAAFYEGEADREIRQRWATELWKTLQPNDDAAYVGFLADEGCCQR